ALSFVSEGNFEKKEKGKFETFGFIETPSKHNPVVKDFQYRVGFDKLPTYQNDDFWNLPEKYKEVIYPDAP
ncbi:MAG: hypothetical protein ABEH43_11630, partial [Flavobacteriales bacterium]